MSKNELVNFSKGSTFESLTMELFKLTFMPPEEEDKKIIDKLIEDIGDDEDADVKDIVEDLKMIKNKLENDDEEYFEYVVKLGQDVHSIL